MISDRIAEERAFYARLARESQQRRAEDAARAEAAEAAEYEALERAWEAQLQERQGHPCTVCGHPYHALPYGRVDLRNRCSEQTCLCGIFPCADCGTRADPVMDGDIERCAGCGVVTGPIWLAA